MSNAITCIAFIKADHIQNCFIPIKFIEFDDPDKAEKFWNELPEEETQDTKVDDYNLLADQLCSDDLTDTKCVSLELIEKHIGQTVEQAIADRQRPLGR